MAVLAALKTRLNLNCPLALVPGYLVLNWMETEEPTTDTTGMDGSEGEPGGRVMCMDKVQESDSEHEIQRIKKTCCHSV